MSSEDDLIHIRKNSMQVAIRVLTLNEVPLKAKFFYTLTPARFLLAKPSFS